MPVHQIDEGFPSSNLTLGVSFSEDYVATYDFGMFCIAFAVEAPMLVLGLPLYGSQLS